jgi:DMSO reductase family type II enzyme heme b subunit
MKQSVSLIPAPTVTQPGGYVPVAYADRGTPRTTQAEIAVAAVGKGWKITLAWACGKPVQDMANETDKFVDACAVLVPQVADAPWMSMGEPGKALQGLLWRPDKSAPFLIHAEGLGSVKRTPAPASAKVSGAWRNGRWQVVFELPEWPALEKQRQIALAVWQGQEQERAGLKSISAGWLALD